MTFLKNNQELENKNAHDAEVVNNLHMTISTVNGSGSITSNTTLLRAFFRMGIPVSGKNIFPSNIQGEPTWYAIRVNKEGFLGRIEKNDVVVAMNPSVFLKDLESLVPGGVLFYADDITASITREDIVAYPMPVKKLIKDSDVPANLRGYMANMVYVGIVSHMLGVPLEKISQVLDWTFQGKKTAVDANMGIVSRAAEWAASNLEKINSYRVEEMNSTNGLIVSEGNIAAALGAIYGGVQFVAWYPITPATSLSEALHEYLPILRKDPITGKNSFVILQAEDELAGIGMGIGAGWAGLRSMTSTSGPGLSLMTEYLGLAYFTEIPVVIWNVQRQGPSTGMPTRTAQGDLTFVNFMSHGDTHFIMLIPGNLAECFEFSWKAFDLAEHFQTPVVCLSDQDLGMNQWMGKAFEYPDQPLNRGKVLWEQGLEKMLKRLNGKWGRYMDVDGDGIPYRTLPGNRHPGASYFNRGTGHDECARYSESPVVWEKNTARLKRKYESSKSMVPKPIIQVFEGAKAGIISLGSSDEPVQEVLHQLVKQRQPLDYLRVRAIPFTDEVKDFIDSHERIYAVENNQDGQLRQLLSLFLPDKAMKLYSVSHSDGLPLTASWIINKILEQEEK